MAASAIRSWMYCRSRMASRLAIRSRSTVRPNRATRRASDSAIGRSMLEATGTTGDLTIARRCSRAKFQKRRQERAGALEAVEGRLESLADAAHADHGDERLEDVVGPFADRVDAGVAHHPFVGLVGEIALAAVDLERLVDDCQSASVEKTLSMAVSSM